MVGTCPDLGTIRPIAQPLRAYARRLSRELAAAQTIAVVAAGGRTVSLGDLLGPEFATATSCSPRPVPSVGGRLRRGGGGVLPSCLDALGDTADAPLFRSHRPAGRPGSAGGRPPGHRGRRGRGARRAGRPARPVARLRRRPRPSDARSNRRPRPPPPDRLEPDGTIGGACMPEAVIVATARSPIGRADKGSLVDMPAGRPGRRRSCARRSTRCPQLDPHDIDDLLLGCGLPGGEQGFNMARVVAVQLGYDFLPGTTITRYCSSSLQTTRMAFHAIRAGEGDVFISAGVETVSRFAGAAPTPGRTPRTRCSPRPGSARDGGRGRRDWHDPREDGLLPDVYIADGADRGEPRAAQGRHPRGDGPLRRPLAEPRREGDRGRLLGPRDHPGDAARRHRGHHRRRPAGRRDATRRWPGSSRCSARTAGSPPATAARSTTAPRRWSS